MFIIRVMIFCTIALIAKTGFAAEQNSFQSLPVEMVEEIFSHLSPQELRAARVDDRTDAIIEFMDPNSFNKRFKRIEALLELEEFIPLPNSNQALSHIGISQELWVEVMGNNPSRFTDKKYCPNSHKIKDVYRKNGNVVKVEMCRDLPVETIKAKEGESKYSDQAFIDRLNVLYEIQKLDTRFRRATAQEYSWADEAGGIAPKQIMDTEFWKYVTYHQISDRAPLDLSRPSPSGEHQTHGVKAKLPNILGFYRSGVWEWTDTVVDSVRVLVGGSWSTVPERAVSGFRYLIHVGPRVPAIGAARLVRI